MRLKRPVRSVLLPIVAAALTTVSSCNKSGGSDGQIGAGGPTIEVDSRCAEAVMLALGETEESALERLRDRPKSLAFGQGLILRHLTTVASPFGGELWLALEHGEQAAEVIPIPNATDESNFRAKIDEDCEFELV